jgi:hypothetical protein
MKATPHPTATNRRRCLSMAIFAEISGKEYSNSEVISIIIAVTASHKLKSDVVKGKNICSP